MSLLTLMECQQTTPTGSGSGSGSGSVVKLKTAHSLKLNIYSLFTKDCQPNYPTSKDTT